MQLPPARLVAAGDSALRLVLAEAISDEAHRHVMAWLAALDAERPAHVLDVVPGYTSLLVIYDNAFLDANAVRAWVAAARAQPDAASPPVRLVEVPVWYHASVAPDLEPLASEKALEVAELVARHTAPEYRVHMLGFRPGFPYLGGLDPRLSAPRLATPRPEVAAGSVGIAGAQTGIYPVTSPGGWRIVGRTPLRLFDLSRSEPFLFRVGDRVRFVPIDEARYRERDAG